MPLRAQLHGARRATRGAPPPGAMESRSQARSQMEFGSEREGGERQNIQKLDRVGLAWIFQRTPRPVRPVRAPGEGSRMGEGWTQDVAGSQREFRIIGNTWQGIYFSSASGVSRASDGDGRRSADAPSVHRCRRRPDGIPRSLGVRGIFKRAATPLNSPQQMSRKGVPWLGRSGLH